MVWMRYFSSRSLRYYELGVSTITIYLWTEANKVHEVAWCVFSIPRVPLEQCSRSMNSTLLRFRGRYFFKKKQWVSVFQPLWVLWFFHYVTKTMLPPNFVKVNHSVFSRGSGVGWGCRWRKVRPWQPELNGDWPAIPYLVRGTRPSEIQSLPSLGYIKHIPTWRIFNHTGWWDAPGLVVYFATWKEGEWFDCSAWLQVAMVYEMDVHLCPWHADLVSKADFSIDWHVAEGICWDWWPVQI